MSILIKKKKDYMYIFFMVKKDACLILHIQHGSIVALDQLGGPPGLATSTSPMHNPFQPLCRHKLQIFCVLLQLNSFSNPPTQVVTSQAHWCHVSVHANKLQCNSQKFMDTYMCLYRYVCIHIYNMITNLLYLNDLMRVIL